MITCKYTKTIKDEEQAITTSLEVSDENDTFAQANFLIETIVKRLWDKFEKKNTSPIFKDPTKEANADQIIIRQGILEEIEKVIPRLSGTIEDVITGGMKICCSGDILFLELEKFVDKHITVTVTKT
jgi:hypothetical protein